jgi:hypothetical protein
MTPRDVDALSSVELEAFWRYAEEDVRAQQRAARKAQRRR